MRRKGAFQFSKVLFRSVAYLVFLCFSLIPILWLVQNSIKSRVDIFAYPPKFFIIPDLSSWKHLFEDISLRYTIINSVLVATISTIVVSLFGSLAAYSFSRFRFPFRKILLMTIIMGRLLPPISAVVVLYLLFSRLGLIDTKTGLIILYSALNVPMATWLIKSSFDSVPTELEDAALVDGCTRTKAAIYVTLPIAIPGIAASSVIFFVTSWNEFMFAYIFTSVKARTVPVVLAQTLGEFEIYWGDLAAQSTLIVLPALLVAIVAQRYLIKGLSAGAMK